jgi:hypothetical protein
MQRVLAVVLLFFFFAPVLGAESLGVLMSGGAEVPGPGDPDGLGFADLVFRGTRLFYSVVVFSIGAPTAMHIHPGSPGADNPPLVTFPAFTGNTAVGQFDLDQATVDSILADPNAFYLNVHNDAFPNGAVRGQLQYAYYLPVVGRVSGVGGTTWVSRMAMINLSETESSNGFLEFFPQSTTGTATRSLIQLQTLPRLSQRLLENAPAPQILGIGAVKVFIDNHTGITARILNDRTEVGEGTTGFSYSAMKLEHATTFGELPDLSTSTDADISTGVGYRTNVGFFNPQLFPVEAFFEARSNDGVVLGSARFTIPSGSMQQQSVESLIPLAGGEQTRASFFVFWFTSAPSFVYASVVDNRTGDSTYINGASRRF